MAVGGKTCVLASQAFQVHPPLVLRLAIAAPFSKL